jgi:hypothetical protein
LNGGTLTIKLANFTGNVAAYVGVNLLFQKQMLLL